jgi:hypothetical protein
VAVGLVADVPHDAVAKAVVDVVQCDGQLDGAEARREVAAGLRAHVDDLGAQLRGQLRQLLARSRATSADVLMWSSRLIAPPLTPGLAQATRRTPAER